MPQSTHFCRIRAGARLAFPGTVRYQFGMSDESINQLARKLAESLPEGIQGMREDIEKNFRAALKGGLSKMDLVTREEFSVQQAVLLRTREQLEQLEDRLKQLEPDS